MALKCQLCDQEKPLVKAHIMPKKYFLELRRGSSKKHMIEITVGEKLYERFSQNGIYDPFILCGDCDNLKLGTYDSYAYSLFPPELDELKIRRVSADAEIYPLEIVDAAKLKRFFLGLLWRLHITHYTLGKCVDLGPSYASLIKNTLLGKTDEALKYVSCTANLLLHPTYSKLIEVLLIQYLQKRVRFLKGLPPL
jgi:hypothetical protein